MRTLYLLLAIFLLAGCVSTPSVITSQPTPPVLKSKTIVSDLQAAAYNLDQAVAIGALPADDPAPKCLHAVLIKAGIEVPAGQPPAKSFEPKNDGLASLGSIAYIQVQQAKALRGEKTPVSVDCRALLGTFVLDGAAGLAKVLPVRGLLR